MLDSVAVSKTVKIKITYHTVIFEPVLPCPLYLFPHLAPEGGQRDSGCCLDP